MTGTATQNYDLVMEFAEKSIQKLLSEIFDTDGFLSTIIEQGVNAIPGVNVDIHSPFTVNLSFDVPQDIRLPQGTTDTVDILIDLVGVLVPCSIRIVVGLDVDRTTSSSLDIARLNFQNKLYYNEVLLGNTKIPDPLNVFANFLRNTLKQIPLIPVPVDRTTNDATKIKSLETRIIDDTSPSDLDAAALALSFGGGVQNNSGAFTSSFVPEGGNGAIAIFFSWLCRILGPAVESALQLPSGSFGGCHLNTPLKIDEDNDVNLTQLDLSLANGWLQLSATVEKNGTCYSASASVSGKILIEVENGNLVVKSQIDDPVVNINIPWYCWVIAALLGIITGGLFGVVGAIIGGVLIPLILWIAENIVENIVQNVGQRITDALNEVTPDVNVPAVGLNLIFEKVFIDDIVAKFDVDPVDNSPVKAEGDLVLNDDDYVDLDNGKVGNTDLVGYDLHWTGQDQDRRFETTCISGIARTSWTRFPVPRFCLYGLHFENPSQIALGEIAQIERDWWAPWIVKYHSYFNIYGVLTNEGRYSIIQVYAIDDHHVWIHYRTYAKSIEPTLDIIGRFIVRKPLQPSTSSTSNSSFIRAKAAEGRIGRWIGQLVLPLEAGRFSATTNGVEAPLDYAWYINNTKLEPPTGSINAGLGKMNYAVNGASIVLTPKNIQAFNFELKVIVTDAKGLILTAVRCLKFVSQVAVDTSLIPVWTEYRRAYSQVFGYIQAKSLSKANASTE